jgi:hypothetical protein
MKTYRIKLKNGEFQKVRAAGIAFHTTAISFLDSLNKPFLVLALGEFSQISTEPSKPPKKAPEHDSF